MGGMEVFLPLLEHVEFDESKSCEITNGEGNIIQVKTSEKNTSRFVCTFKFPRKTLPFKFLRKVPVKFLRISVKFLRKVHHMSNFSEKYFMPKFSEKYFMSNFSDSLISSIHYNYFVVS